MLFAEIVPIMIMVIASIMMIEAAGSVDETTMTRLEGLKTYLFRHPIKGTSKNYVDKRK